MVCCYYSIRGPAARFNREIGAVLQNPRLRAVALNNPVRSERQRRISHAEVRDSSLSLRMTCKSFALLLKALRPYRTFEQIVWNQCMRPIPTSVEGPF